ncbi:MAG: tRNA pseudouridine(55) synthase TruB [Desulfobacteraceae bacterium]|jgi:tRNA pseudouridine55 synthase|nr:tRNA pseudouridine(55) synthase TruB [Desulfobacteraceae bacterium]
MAPELNGIVVVDKPKGISSAGVVARVKELFGVKKVGHTGTLDPFATGVLICCINQATRLSQFFLKGDKVYEAELVLGSITDTQDATGTVIERHPLNGVSAEQVHEMAARFVGTISQVPPVYSALKHQGTPLYKLARQGSPVEKPARSVRINHLEILEVNLPAVRFSVSCSSGTYVRTLCADIGRNLGCGGHLNALCRKASCGFGIEAAFSLEKLAEFRLQGRLGESVIPMNEALPFMPAVVADNGLAKRIRNGMKLSESDLPIPPRGSDQGVFKVVDAHGRLIAVLAESPATGSVNYCCVFSA